jgi:hypothetical protein
MSRVTGVIGYSDEEMERCATQRTNRKRSTTGGTRSLVGVSGSTNIHAGSAAEVAYMKFDEDMVFYS